MDIEQTPILFGPERNLVGVITSPATSKGAPVACLMLNMGANHRGGPHRINVKLAHRLASMGMISLRMDLSGLGDSGPSSSGGTYQARCVADLQAGMDLISTTFGIRSFVVVGLCSGVLHTMNVAVADPRVIGILMFDGYSFAGRRWRWERTLRRALAAPTNPAILGKTARWFRRTFNRGDATGGDGPVVNIFDTEKNTPAQDLAMFRQSVSKLVAHEVEVYLLFSGTQHVRDVDRDHLGPLAREPWAAKVRYEFSSAIDHTMTSLSAQEAFLACASTWALDIAMPELGLATGRPESPSAWGALESTSGSISRRRRRRRSSDNLIETVY